MAVSKLLDLGIIFVLLSLWACRYCAEGVFDSDGCVPDTSCCHGQSCSGQLFQPPNFSRSLYAQLWQLNLVIAEWFVIQIVWIPVHANLYKYV